MNNSAGSPAPMYLTSYACPLPNSPHIRRIIAPIAPSGSPPPGPPNSFAAVSALSLLDPDFAQVASAAQLSGCPRLLCDSGRLSGTTPAEASLANWGPQARRAFDEACAGLDTGNLVVCPRPRCGDVLSDVPSSLNFLRAHGGRFGLFLEPAALLDESMLERADDHLERSLDHLLGHPGLCAVAATNLTKEADGRLGCPAPLHLGVLDSKLILRLAARAVEAGVPVVLHPRELDAQCRALGLSPDET